MYNTLARLHQLTSPFSRRIVIAYFQKLGSPYKTVALTVIIILYRSVLIWGWIVRDYFSFDWLGHRLAFLDMTYLGLMETEGSAAVLTLKRFVPQVYCSEVRQRVLFGLEELRAEGIRTREIPSVQADNWRGEWRGRYRPITGGRMEGVRNRKSNQKRHDYEKTYKHI